MSLKIKQLHVNFDYCLTTSSELHRFLVFRNATSENKYPKLHDVRTTSKQVRVFPCI